MKLKHKTLIRCSGVIWLLIGFLLMRKGITLLMEATATFEGYLLPSLSGATGSPEGGVVILVAIALVIGMIKGRVALSRSAARVVSRIRSLPNPSPFYMLYHWSFYLLIGSMMGIGIIMKVTGVPLEVRGTILLAVGAALANGSVNYFKMAQSR